MDGVCRVGSIGGREGQQDSERGSHCVKKTRTRELKALMHTQDFGKIRCEIHFGGPQREPHKGRMGGNGFHFGRLLHVCVCGGVLFLRQVTGWRKL